MSMTGTVRTFILSITLFATSAVGAVETRLMIRARAEDGKFIGDKTGNMTVVVEDVESGVVLDQGRITGTTGDTDRLMRTPEARGMRLSTEGAAGYLATVDIEEPRRLRFTITGPFLHRDAVQRFSMTRWVLPGQQLLGDGIIVPVAGLIVMPEVTDVASDHATIHANVQLMCGCPLIPGGLWDADEYELRVQLLSGGQVLSEEAMSYAGEPSLFTADVQLRATGLYRIRVIANHPQTGNVGVGWTTFSHD